MSRALSTLLAPPEIDPSAFVLRYCDGSAGKRFSAPAATDTFGIPEHNERRSLSGFGIRTPPAPQGANLHEYGVRMPSQSRTMNLWVLKTKPAACFFSHYMPQITYLLHFLRLQYVGHIMLCGNDAVERNWVTSSSEKLSSSLYTNSFVLPQARPRHVKLGRGLESR